jgi:hypothetical protein
MMNLLMLITVVSALHLEPLARPDYFNDPSDIISAANHLDLDPIQNPTNKNSVVFISPNKDFVELFSVLALKLEATPHLHYLPIYSLVHEKEYFLLI